MKAILLDGSLANDSSGERVRAVLTAQLQTQGWEVEHFALCEKKIGNCAGGFFYWVRTPGVCNVNDDNRAVADSSRRAVTPQTPFRIGSGHQVVYRASSDAAGRRRENRPGCTCPNLPALVLTG